ncbi:Hpt domain-containing protein [Candidatus Woesebacteria bacterium]|nr:Hpt domain-containing protein [Candidatus Woesebacteria bacterium]
MVNIDDFTSLYFQTSQEQLSEMLETLKTLQKKEYNEQAIKTMRRLAHTIKGKSLMMGFTTFGTLFKSIEELFRTCQEYHQSIKAALLDELRDVLITMQRQLTAKEKHTEEPNDLESAQKTVYTLLQTITTKD